MTSPMKNSTRKVAGREPSPQEINTLVALFRQERYAEVETLAKSLTARFPDHGIGWKAMGTSLLQQGRNAEALAPLQKAAKLSHGDAQLHNYLGNTLLNLGRLPAAEASYRQALKIKTDFAEAHSNLGVALLDQDRPIEAEASYRQALKIKPDFVEALSNLGDMLLKQSRLPEAEVCYRRMLEIRPDYADVYDKLGSTLRKQGRLPEAEACYRRALEIKPDFVKMHANLGNILQDQSRLSEAEACYQHALKIDTRCSEALLGLGSLCMENGQPEQAEGLFLQALEIMPDNLAARWRLANAKKVKAGDVNFAALVDAGEALQRKEISLSNNNAAILHFALGKCYDDIGDFEKAFPHFLEGCKLKRASFNYHPDQPAQQFAEIKRIFDQTAIDRLRGAGNPSNVPVFVLGMPRSGTTLTEQIIASHPEVHGAGELPDLLAIAQRADAGSGVAFPGNLRSLNQATLTAWGAEYIAGLKQRAPDARRITDKNPENFMAIGWIHLMLPNAKIIHVNRNPVDTCLSCFTQLFAHNNQKNTYDLAELGRFYVDYSCLMEHWRKVLPAGAFLDVNYEDIVADQEAQARRMIEYCGLEWSDACLDFHKTKRSVRTASMAQVRQPMYKSSVERWRNYEKFLGPLLDALSGLEQNKKPAQ